MYKDEKNSFAIENFKGQELVEDVECSRTKFVGLNFYLVSFFLFFV